MAGLKASAVGERDRAAKPWPALSGRGRGTLEAFLRGAIKLRALVRDRQEEQQVHLVGTHLPPNPFEGLQTLAIWPFSDFSGWRRGNTQIEGNSMNARSLSDSCAEPLF